MQCVRNGSYCVLGRIGSEKDWDGISCLPFSIKYPFQSATVPNSMMTLGKNFSRLIITIDPELPEDFTWPKTRFSHSRRIWFNWLVIARNLLLFLPPQWEDIMLCVRMPSSSIPRHKLISVNPSQFLDRSNLPVTFSLPSLDPPTLFELGQKAEKKRKRQLYGVFERK